jgi:arylsulfatase A-like enzyme
MTAASAAAATRPNIIVICTDQQTASAMSCAGNGDLATPNMDRLAAAGVRFVNAYCTSPLSGPSRSAMFTGYYPESIGMSVNGAPLPDSLASRTLGSLVKAAGYDCAYAGKWHVPESAVPDKVRGFDCIHPHSDIGLAEACVSYLDAAHKKPFFLVASYDNPHNICEFAREQNLPYGNIEPADLGDCPGLPANFAKNPYDADVIEEERAANYKVYPTVRYSPDDWRRYRYTYYRLVEKVDKEIGKIVDAIDRNNLWDNTVVIFTSDHGDGVGAHHWNQKSALYEEVVNIPLIVALPGKANAGRTCSQLVSNGIDLFASICDWAGVPSKETASRPGVSFRAVACSEEDGFRSENDLSRCKGDGMSCSGDALSCSEALGQSGKNDLSRCKGDKLSCSGDALSCSGDGLNSSEDGLSNGDLKKDRDALSDSDSNILLEETTTNSRPYIIAETRFDGSTTRGWMVRTPRYKYVLYDKGPHREQLFDMQSDRGETRNLAVENAFAPILAAHRALLEQWMENTNIHPTRPILHDVPGKVRKK